MSIKKRTTVRYTDEDRGFEFQFEPVERSLSIVETPIGYEVRYLTVDDSPDSPSEWRDNGLFLINYHRGFWVENREIISKEDLISWYRGETIPQAKDYHIFVLSALIHSGVWLSLNYSFPEDSGGWDTSHVGAVLASKKEWQSKQSAYKAAQGLVATWNQYLSGDVYGIVVERYNKNKQQINDDAAWGFYGYDYAIKALQTDI